MSTRRTESTVGWRSRRTCSKIRYMLATSSEWSTTAECRSTSVTEWIFELSTQTTQHSTLCTLIHSSPVSISTANQRPMCWPGSNLPEFRNVYHLLCPKWANNRHVNSSIIDQKRFYLELSQTFSKILSSNFHGEPISVFYSQLFDRIFNYVMCCCACYQTDDNCGQTKLNMIIDCGSFIFEF